MNKERYNQIIDEAYEHYSEAYKKDNSVGLSLLVQRRDGKAAYHKPDKQRFVAMCTYDKSFSDRWGLKIEERELSTEERNQWYHINWNANNPLMKSDWKFYELDQQNVPTKLITVIYKDEKIEVYE